MQNAVARSRMTRRGCDGGCGMDGGVMRCGGHTNSVVAYGRPPPRVAPTAIGFGASSVTSSPAAVSLRQCPPALPVCPHAARRPSDFHRPGRIGHEPSRQRASRRGGPRKEPTRCCRSGARCSISASTNSFGSGRTAPDADAETRPAPDNSFACTRHFPVRRRVGRFPFGRVGRRPIFGVTVAPGRATMLSSAICVNRSFRSGPENVPVSSPRTR
jgi:hypothetical protein